MLEALGEQVFAIDKQYLFFTGVTGATGSAGTETIESYGKISFKAEDMPFY